MSITVVLKGRELSAADIQKINEYRKREFNSKRTISPSPENDDWNKQYCLVREDGNLVAFARLHNIEIEFEGVKHNILGIASVVAMVRDKGYGSQLMDGVKRFIERSGLTAIGFCNVKTAEFYKKCGYSIYHDGLKQFVFYDAGGNQVPSRYSSGDVLYVDGEDCLMSKVKLFPDDLVSAYRPEW